MQEKTLDFVANNSYNVVGYTEEVFCVAEKSRADYFRERRKTYKQFIVNLDRTTIDELDKKLKAQGLTRTDWLKRKIAEELSK